MSWSGHCLIPKGASEDEAVSAIEGIQVSGNDDCPEQRDAASTIARGAAAMILGSGALGDPAANGWYVHIGGHATPGNMLDSISANVSARQE